MSTPSTLVAGRYRLVKLLGAGGMGVVWQAWDERLERSVALKMLRTQPELTEPEREVATNRAMREARITAGLHHPHAVTVYDVIEHEGRPCLVMELIESTPLSILLREHGTLTPEQTARIGAQVGSALAAAHKMRIVHRDVKPGNILITADGSAKISDFGISHALGDATITATGMIHGTPAYLAPEVARGRPSSFASDVFSLGSTLYAMLEGEPPFGADKNAIALLHRVARGGYPPPKHAGVLAPLLWDMLSADPKHRPAMTAVAASLSADQGAPPPPLGPTTSVPTQSPLHGATTQALPVENESASDTPEVAAVVTHPASASVRDPEPKDSPVEALTRPEVITAKTTPLEDAVRHDAPTLQAPLGRTEPMDQPTRFEPPTAETEPLAKASPPPTVKPPRTPRRPPPTRPGTQDGPVTQAAPVPLPWPLAEPVPNTQPVLPRRRRAGAVVGVLLVVAAAIVGAVIFLSALRQDAGTAAAPTNAALPTSSVTPRATTTPTAPVASPSPTPVTQPSVQPPPPTPEERVVQAITDYYALVPGDLDSAWPTMTADYQKNHAGGRRNYNAFWAAIAQVDVADVSASAPDQGRATLTYHYNDGRVVQEVTTYQLVEEDGVLKIAASDVISSVDL